MFDIKKILSRSWHILWNYKVLWIFGFILALGAGGADFGNQSRYSFEDGARGPNGEPRAPEGWEIESWEDLQGDTFGEKMNDAFRQVRAVVENLREQYPEEFRMGVAVAVTAVVVAFVFGILVAVLRYVSEMAAIRMVDEYEGTGVKVGFRQGWRYGWSRDTWRLFWVNFVVHLPALVLFVVIGLVVWWIFSALMSGVQWSIISSVIAGSGLIFLAAFTTAILMVVLYVVRDLAWRMIALEGKAVREGLREAWAMLRRQWKNAGLMWLVMTGIRIAWSITFVILIIPLLVVSVLTAVGGLAAALVPALLTAGIAGLLAAPDYWPWIFALIVGLPFFAVVTFSPILLVSGWWQIFRSSAWTLTWRELKAIEAIEAVGLNG
ncbi:MAG TPA: hypothetical protein VMN57_11870 [Anaerolineales bacterium]|nr:hypothetical protein [Anaerolineales bacterium]